MFDFSYRCKDPQNYNIRDGFWQKISLMIPQKITVISHYCY